MTTLVKLTPIRRLVKFSGPRNLVTFLRGAVVSRGLRAYVFGAPLRVADGVLRKSLNIEGSPSEDAPLVINKPARLIGASVRLDAAVAAGFAWDVEFEVDSVVVETISLVATDIGKSSILFNTSFAAGSAISVAVSRVSGSGASTWRHMTVSVEISEEP